LLPDSLAVHEEWRTLLVTHGVSGVQVHVFNGQQILNAELAPISSNSFGKQWVAP